MSDFSVAGSETTTWREEGVLLGYVSGTYSQKVLGTDPDYMKSDQSSTSPISVRSNISDPLTEPDNVLPDWYDFDQLESIEGEAASYDPLQRERYAHPILASLLSSEDSMKQLMAESVVSAHEDTHLLLSNTYPQQYSFERLRSYTLTAELLEGVNPTEEGFLRRVIEVPEVLIMSELAHEARALQTQAEFFRMNQGPNASKKFKNKYTKQISNVLSEGDDTGLTDVENLEHQLALWLAEEIIDEWDIPILEVAFRLRDSDKAATIHPDVILWAAATADRSEVATCDAENQWDLLLEQLESDNTSPDSLACGEIPSLPNSPENVTDSAAQTAGIETSSTSSDVFRMQREQNLKTPREGGTVVTVPLWANSYPGQHSAKTLYNILDSIYVTTVGGERQLLIEPSVYQWAKGTDLLDMAIKLWRVREKTIIPIFRSVKESSKLKETTLSEQIRAVHTNSASLPTPVDMSDVPQNMYMTAEAVEETLSDIRDRSKDLRRNLRELGFALLQSDKQTIQRYL